MSSNKQKGQKLKLTRAERRADLERARLLVRLRKEDLENAALLSGMRDGTVIAADKSKITSRSAIPKVPDYYRDIWFTCKDCGKRELWTARQQQRWYEQQGGEIESVAVRCHACRRVEKLRRATARKVHPEGLAKRRSTKPNAI